MSSIKNLGIWMDHSTAHLMEFTTGSITTTIVKSDVTHQSPHQNENLMHNKENNQSAGYYHKLAEIIKNYDKVLLFGPTEAKSELLNRLRLDRHFEKIKIEVQPADKMTENQEHAFVKAYFDEN